MAKAILQLKDQSKISAMGITNSKNFYELLGVERTASSEKIKEAYKSIALVYHPDSNFFSEIIDEKPDISENETFKKITEAYNTLTKPDLRAQYDATLPPELPSWDDPREDVIGSKISSYDPSKPSNCGATSAVYGIFGSQINNSFEEEEEEELEEPTMGTMGTLGTLGTISNIVICKTDLLIGRIKSLFMR